jgi:hypothetical protein
MFKIAAATLAGRERLALIQVRFVATRLHRLSALSLRHEAMSENDLWTAVSQWPELDESLHTALTAGVLSAEPGQPGPAVHALIAAYALLAEHLAALMSEKQTAVVRLVLERTASLA